MNIIGDLAIRFCLIVLPTFAAIGVCWAIEQRWPARVGRRADGLQNVKILGASVVAQEVVTPCLAA